MMKGVLTEITPIVINADSLHDMKLPFGIDEVSDDDFNSLAQKVAEEIVKKYVHGDCQPIPQNQMVCDRPVGGCCR